MRITLKPGDTIPVNAKFVQVNLSGNSFAAIVVEVPDPTPPAPKMIVFVADGEPRRNSGEATHYICPEGDFLRCGKNISGHVHSQHYRQLPALTPELHELRNAWINTKKGSHAEAWFYEIIAAMESAKGVK